MRDETPAKLAPWLYHLMSVAARYGEEDVARLARLVGKSEALVTRAMRRPAYRREWAGLCRAAKRVAQEQVASVAEALERQTLPAAEALGDALQWARAQQDVRQTRETAVAILAHTGHGPQQRVQVQHAHVVANLSDPEVLKRIASDPVFARQVALTGKVPEGEGA